MNLASITPVILTWNEEANIARTLDALRWAGQIILLDSGSTDATEAICKSFSNVHWHQRPFDSHSNQWNAAIALSPSEWVLTLDADYLVPPSLLEEIRNLPETSSQAGFRVPFIYCVNGEPLPRSLLPPRVALFQRSRGRYFQDGHTQDLSLNGDISALSEAILHDDRKPFRRWLSSQWKYADLEAYKLSHKPFQSLSPQDKLRKLILPGPPAVALYCLIVQKMAFAGKAGLIYSAQRIIAESTLSIVLAKRLLNRLRNSYAAMFKSSVQ